MTREEDYYNYASVWEHERYEDPFERSRWKTCIDMIPQGATSLLDVGAGNGFFLKLLEETCPGLDLTGIERSKAAILAKVCKTNLTEASIESMPFGDGAFDVVSALDVIEHLPRGVYERALKEMQRVSRHYILINVPYKEKRLKAVCPYCSCEFNPHYHMRSFDEQALLSLFSGFGRCSSTKLYRKENLIAIAARPFRRNVFSGFPQTALCPQCGYRENDNVPQMQGESGGMAQIIKKAVRGVSELFPRIPVTQEIAVLYQHNGT